MTSKVANVRLSEEESAGSSSQFKVQASFCLHNEDLFILVLDWICYSIMSVSYKAAQHA